MKKNEKLNILHLFKISLPNLSGYTIRSHNILIKQKNFANPYALSSPFFLSKDKIDSIDGVYYYRYPRNTKVNLFKQSKITDLFYFARLINKAYFSLLKVPISFINEIVTKKNIDLIHGCSNERFSKYGEKVAHKRGLPFIYEVRGFWEDSLVINGILKKFGYNYMKIRKKETNLMKKADLIITLGKMMEKEIISRGISKDKIKIVPNAVDTNVFKPILPNKRLILKFKIQGKRVIAYIGSIRKIEGIEVLIKSIKFIKEEYDNIILLLIGSISKEYKRELSKLISSLKLSDYIYFTGKVNPNEIINYYSITEIIIIPRIKSRVNALVTPLKQLEAMAMQKVVITSDLPALREHIKPRVSGDVFKAEDYVDLAKKIKHYLSNPELMIKLGIKARDFVKKKYDWEIVIEKYNSIYKKISDNFK